MPEERLNPLQWLQSKFASLVHTHTSNQVTDLIDTIYPVGSIYMSVSNTSPSILFGGTWEQIEDTFLLASGTNYANGSTGGEATHTLTTNEMPSHTHTQNSHNHTQNAHHHLPLNNGTRGFVTNVKSSTIGENKVKIDSSSSYYSPTIKSTDDWYSTQYTDNTTATNNSQTATNQNTGGGQAHENMPPYLAVNVWKRTA